MKKETDSSRMTVNEAYEAQQERERILRQQAQIRKILIETSTKEIVLSPQQ